MKMKQVADRLGKHDNTIRYYAKQYGEFLSPAPDAGEVRVFTDEDVNVLSYVCQLTETGLKYEAIRDNLRHRFETNKSIPPSLPPPPPPDRRVAVFSEPELLVDTALVNELTGRVESLKQQIDVLNQQRENDREVYLRHIMQINQSHNEQIQKLSVEMGRLQAQNQAQGERRQDQHDNVAEDRVVYQRQIEQLTEQLLKLSSETGALKTELEKARQELLKSKSQQRFTDKKRDLGASDGDAK